MNIREDLGATSNPPVETRANINAPAGADNTAKYPVNTNIFIVSNSRYADIRFSNGSLFTGFVYAPYMTFNYANSSGQEPTVLLGGMIVSDYVISTLGYFVGVKPDNDLVGYLTGSGSGGGVPPSVTPPPPPEILPTPDRTWKFLPSDRRSFVVYR
jgi:hypothetical protein